MAKRYYLLIDTYNERGEQSRLRVAGSDDYSVIREFKNACLVSGANIIEEDDGEGRPFPRLTLN